MIHNINNLTSIIKYFQCLIRRYIEYYQKAWIYLNFEYFQRTSTKVKLTGRIPTEMRRELANVYCGTFCTFINQKRDRDNQGQEGKSHEDKMRCIRKCMMPFPLCPTAESRIIEKDGTFNIYDKIPSKYGFLDPVMERKDAITYTADETVPRGNNDIIHDPECDLLKLNNESGYNYYTENQIFTNARQQCESKRGREMLRKLRTDNETALQCLELSKNQTGKGGNTCKYKNTDTDEVYTKVCSDWNYPLCVSGED